jgi:hypothetical protein
MNIHTLDKKNFEINRIFLKLKQLQMKRKLKYNQPRNVLNQLNELEQLKELLKRQFNQFTNLIKIDLIQSIYRNIFLFAKLI